MSEKSEETLGIRIERNCLLIVMSFSHENLHSLQEFPGIIYVANLVGCG